MNWSAKAAALLCLIVVPAGVSRAQQLVEYRHILETGPLSIHVVSFDLDTPSYALNSIVGKGVNGSETISEMMAQIPATAGTPIAAVNGDYFEFLTEPRYRGTLQGMTIVSNELMSGPAGTTFWLDDKRQPHLRRITSNFLITWPNHATTPFGLNCSPSDYKSEVRNADVVLFTPSFGPTTMTTKVREIVLEPAPGSAWLPLRPNAKIQARVRAIETAGNTPLRAGEMVLSIAAKADANVPAVQVGDIIGINTALTPDLSKATAAIAGDPHLLKDGLTMPKLSTADRHPRTAIGFAGRRCFLVVVDGRQQQLSIGATHAEMAAIMQGLGCTDALNLDGGGSTTMWWRGRVVNSPSSGAERPVGNGLALMALPVGSVEKEK